MDICGHKEQIMKCDFCYKGPVNLQGDKLPPREAIALVHCYNNAKRPVCKVCLESASVAPEFIPLEKQGLK